MVPPVLFLLVALMAAAGLAPLAGQEADTLPAPADTTPAAVEPSHAPPRFVLSLTVGTLGIGTVQSQPVIVTRHDPAGEVLESATLRRTLEAEGGFRVAAGGLISLDPTWAVRLAGAVGRTTIEPGYAGEPAQLVRDAAALGSQDADVTLLVAEAALRMRIASSRRAQPYLEVGTAVTRWHSGSAPAGATDLADGVGRMGGLAAVGVEVPYSDRLSARLQATTRFSRTPVDPVPAGTEVPADSTLTVTFAAPEARPFADRSHELVSGIRLELGVSLGLGGTLEPPHDPAAPAGSPSPPGR